MFSKSSLVRLVVSFILGVTGVAQPVSSRVVTLTTGDGTRLKATYFPTGKPGPGVLLFHQCNRDRKVWDALGQSLAQAGLSVLALDFRGFGESEGRRWEQMNPQEIQGMMDTIWHSDVDLAFSFLVSQPGVTGGRIAAGGASCGVNQAVQLALRHPEVSSLVLLPEATNRDGRAFIRHSPGVSMFLAVADDDPDPGVVEVMQWLASLSANPANRFEHYSTGGHGVEMFAAHPELPATIVTWLRTTLTHPSAVGAGSKLASQKPNILDWTDQPAGTKELEKILEASRRGSRAIPFSEPVMNRIGYEHLIAGDASGAVEIFQLNAGAYPNSANVYDSLSDGYLAAGQKDLARQNAQKAFQLLPSDTIDSEQRRNAIRDSAEQKLNQLGDGPI